MDEVDLSQRRLTRSQRSATAATSKEENISYGGLRIPPNGQKRKAAGISFILHEAKASRRGYVNSGQAAEQEYARLINVDVREHAYDHCCSVLDELYESVMEEAHDNLFRDIKQYICDCFSCIDEYDEDEQTIPLVAMRVLGGGLNVSDRARSFYWNLLRNPWCGVHKYVPCFIRVNACKSLASFVWEVFRQCCSFDKNYEHDVTERAGSRAKNSSVYGGLNSLRRWAHVTNSDFDSIVVFIEDCEAFLTHNVTLQSVISMLLSTMIPCSIVMSLPSDFEQKLISFVPSNVWNNVKLKYFSLPSSPFLFRKLAKRIAISSNGSLLPIDIRGDLIKVWSKSFLENGTTLSSAIDDLKLILAEHFSRKDSFLPMVLSTSFMAEDNITILHSLSQIRKSPYFISKLFSGEDTIDKNLPKKIPIDTLKYWLERWLQYKRHFSVIIQIMCEFSQEFSPIGEDSFISAVLSEEDEVIELTSKLCQNIDQLSSNPKKLLKLLLKVRSLIKFQIDLASKEDEILSEYLVIIGEHEKLVSSLRTINTFILYVDESSDLGKSEQQDSILIDMRRKITLELQQWIFKQVDDCFRSHYQSNQHKNVDEIFTVQNMSLLSNMSTNPRTMISQALNCPAEILHCNCCRSEVSETMNDTCIAFQTFRPRTITLNDWYRLFISTIKPSNSIPETKLDDKNQLFQQFAMSVYELQLCGLVKQSVTGRKNIIFEKNALVWASGE